MLSLVSWRASGDILLGAKVMKCSFRDRLVKAATHGGAAARNSPFMTCKFYRHTKKNPREQHNFPAKATTAAPFCFVLRAPHFYVGRREGREREGKREKQKERDLYIENWLYYSLAPRIFGFISPVLPACLRFAVGLFPSPSRFCLMPSTCCGSRLSLSLGSSLLTTA